MTDLAPLARPSQLSESVALAIGAWIRDARLPPGERLPTEKTLGERFGVSRAVVREAISRLKADGVVTTRQGAGAFVATRPGAASFRLARPDGLGAESLADVFELRYIVETAAAAMAARRRRRADLSAMGRALTRMEQALHQRADGTEADDAFHVAVAAATGNAAVGRFVQFMGGQFFESRVPTWSEEGFVRGWAQAAQAEHQDLYDAIVARDAGAARRAAQIHLQRAASRLGVDTSLWEEVPVGAEPWETET